VSDFQKRVVDEKHELDAKLVKLLQFTLGATFGTLPVAEQERLARQAVAMEAYSAVLEERIFAFNAA
jgi:hypothetical protein